MDERDFFSMGKDRVPDIWATSIVYKQALYSLAAGGGIISW